MNGLTEPHSALRISATALLFATTVLIWPHPLPAQHAPPTAREVEAFAERASSERTPGNEVRVPDQVFQALIPGPDSGYPPCNSVDRKSFEAHQFFLKPNLRGGLAILGRDECFCSVTGNCELWVYQHKNGKYQVILETNAIQMFGFLKSQTHGYPDLVTWTHESATEYEAQLFRFDGNRYAPSGGWRVDYQYLGPDGQIVTPAEPRITSHFSSEAQLPSEPKP